MTIQTTCNRACSDDRGYPDRSECTSVGDSGSLKANYNCRGDIPSEKRSIPSWGQNTSHDRPNLGNMSAAAAASAVELAEKEKEQRTKGEVKKSLAVRPPVAVCPSLLLPYPKFPNMMSKDMCNCNQIHFSYNMLYYSKLLARLF